MRKVMSYDVEQMEKLYQSCENKMKSSLWFSVKTAGVQNTLIYFGKKILKKLEVKINSKKGLLMMQTATFNGHQGHIIRPDRDIPGH